MAISQANGTANTSPPTLTPSIKMKVFHNKRGGQIAEVGPNIWARVEKGRKDYRQRG